jgi:hypothetical protein
MKAQAWLARRHLGGALLAASMATASLAAQSLAPQTGAPAPMVEAKALPVGTAAGKPAPAPAPEMFPLPADAPLPRVRPWLDRLLFWRRAKPVEVQPVGGPPPTAEELARMESGEASFVEMAATKIKVDEAGAPARRAAIQYLATVKCHYFPEAEAALIAALRCDRNEVVRYEAAQALAKGCCCTSKTVEALQLVVTGSERDGNPAETSERVRAAALVALERTARHGAPAAPPPDMLPPAARNDDAPPPLTAPLQLTTHSTLTIPKAPPPPRDVTEAERRFAETAGTEAMPRGGQPSMRAVLLPPEAPILPPLKIPPITQIAK